MSKTMNEMSREKLEGEHYACFNKQFADKGFHYCFVLTENGWRNQGMVPDNNRQPFIDEYKNGNTQFGVKPKGVRVAFSPFCWRDNSNVFTDSDIYSYCSGSF